MAAALVAALGGLWRRRLAGLGGGSWLGLGGSAARRLGCGGSAARGGFSAARLWGCGAGLRGDGSGSGGRTGGSQGLGQALFR